MKELDGNWGKVCSYCVVFWTNKIYKLNFLKQKKLDLSVLPTQIQLMNYHENVF